jgi:hypothetical protein
MQSAEARRAYQNEYLKRNPEKRRIWIARRCAQQKEQRAAEKAREINQLLVFFDDEFEALKRRARV